MTKYEWESELKKSIHRLPDDEIARVTAYYDELFEDKIECGSKERDIIAEFGNPVDVADKILSEYDGELKPDADARVVPVPLPPVVSRKEERRIGRQESKNSASDNTAEPVRQDASEISETKHGPKRKPGGVRGGRLAVLIVLTVLLGGAVIGVAAGLWACVIGLGAGGIACAAAGAAGCISSAVMLFDSVPVALVQFALCFASVGIGIVLIVLTVKFCKLGFKATRSMFRWIKKLLTKKRATL